MTTTALPVALNPEEKLKKADIYVHNMTWQDFRANIWAKGMPKKDIVITDDRGLLADHTLSAPADLCTKT